MLIYNIKDSRAPKKRRQAILSWGNSKLQIFEKWSCARKRATGAVPTPKPTFAEAEVLQQCREAPLQVSIHLQAVGFQAIFNVTATNALATEP